MRGDSKILLECMTLYKNFNYLWDNRHQLYTNKSERDKAYDIILDKYREMVKDATLLEVKKKLDNMRTSFRREHKKVLLSQMKGEHPTYQPTLWYYEHLIFLNEVAEYNDLEILESSTADENGSIEDIELHKRKKIKRNNSSNAVYLIEPNATCIDSDNDQIDDFVNEMGMMHSEDVNRPNNIINSKDVDTLEAEAFGNLVGHQLKQLDNMQRTVAEKLISDIIFNARIKKLTPDSSLNI